MNDVENYLHEKGFEFKKNGQEFMLVNGCPICGNEKPNHFYISEEGLYHCKICSASGNLITLKKELGDKVLPQDFKKQKPKLKAKTIEKPEYNEKYIEKCHERIYLEKPEIIEYFIKKRGFTEDAVRHFKLGWNGRRITIPVYENKKLVSIRERRNPLVENENEPKYISPTGVDIGMYNVDSIKSSRTPVFITEGEMDTIALWSSSKGTAEVVTSMAGAGTFKKEWAEKYFKGKDKIFLIFDTDEAGVRGSEKVAGMLGIHRTFIVSLPKGIKDLNDFFLSGKTIKDFKALLAKSSRKLKVEESSVIKPISVFAEKVKDIMIHGLGKSDYVGTGFKWLDKMLSGIRPGELMIVSGMTSIGKSFFVQNIIYNLAKKDMSVMFFSLEMLPEEMVERFVMIDSGINSYNFSSGIKGDAGMVQKLDDSISKLSGFPIYFYDGDQTLDKDLLKTVSEKAVVEYGCQLIVVDHLHYFASNSEDVGEISSIVRKSKEITKKHKVPMIMVSHIKKMKSYGDQPGIDDLRNSSLIGQDADIVVMLSGNRLSDDKVEREKVTCSVHKNRHGKTGSVILHFSEKSCKFTEMASEEEKQQNGSVQEQIIETPSQPVDRSNAGFIIGRDD